MKAEPINWKYVRIGECELTARTFNLLRSNGMEILGEVAARSDSDLLAAFKRSMPDETRAMTWRRLLEPLLKKNGDTLDEVVSEWGDLPEDNGPLMTDEEELDRVFQPEPERAKGRPFHVHSEKGIYFVVKQEDGVSVQYIPKYPGSGRKPIHY